jgi:ribonuclease-3
VLLETEHRVASDMLELVGLMARLPGQLRDRALTHYTWVDDDRDSYKRLALLGDSVLDLFVTEDLHGRLPDSRPSRLTMVRSRAVSGVSCAAVGRELGIPQLLEERKESKLAGAVSTEILLAATRPVAEMTEAMIGACYLTFGFDRARSAVLAAFERQIQNGVENPLDPKSMLHTLLARQGARPQYKVISKSGSMQAPVFEMAVVVDSERIGEGEGRSKREAEHAAAACAMARLGVSDVPDTLPTER